MRKRGTGGEVGQPTCKNPKTKCGNKKQHYHIPTPQPPMPCNPNSWGTNVALSVQVSMQAKGKDAVIAGYAAAHYVCMIQADAANGHHTKILSVA